MHLEEGYTVEMKKPHPCGNRIFSVTFTGVDVHLKCVRCGREVVMMRDKAQKAAKKLVDGGQ